MITRRSRMLHSLVFRLYVGPNARVRAVLIPARDARTNTNALFTMCTHPVDNIDEAPHHHRRTIPSTRVTQRNANRVELCVRWFVFRCAVLLGRSCRGVVVRGHSVICDPGLCVRFRISAVFWRGFHSDVSRRYLFSVICDPDLCVRLRIGAAFRRGFRGGIYRRYLFSVICDAELTRRRQSCALARSATKAHARCTRFALFPMSMMFFLKICLVSFCLEFLCLFVAWKHWRFGLGCVSRWLCLRL